MHDETKGGSGHDRPHKEINVLRFNVCIVIHHGGSIGGHQYLFIANENQQINNNDMKNYPHIITSERENQRLYYGYGELRKILQRKGIDSAIAK